MLSEIEMESVMLGILWVSTFADRPLAKAGAEALSKITDVLPPKMRSGMGAVPLRVGPPAPQNLQQEDLTVLRDAIRQELIVKISYKSKGNKPSACTLWPFAIGYFTDGRILVGWCEQQKDYRHFRTDSIVSLTVLEERYPRRRENLFHEWQLAQLKKLSK